MKLVKPKVEFIPQEPTLDGAKKQIEIGGRICYKSEHLITNKSSEKFFKRMLSYGHGSVLEHGTIYLTFNRVLNLLRVKFYTSNPFSKVVFKGLKAYVTTNMRVICENKREDDLKYINFANHHEKRYTFKVTTSRIISQQFTRHRVMSPSQESQRYCNYSKDRFGDDILFIDPVWLTGKENSVGKTLIRSYKESEKNYFDLTSKGVKAEDARDVLANGVKTEFVYTGFESDFLGNFHKLRSHRTAQELMRIQANEICSIITSNQIEKY